MLKINRLREFCAEAKEVIEGINSAWVVVTKEEVSKFMREHHEEDNCLLLAIVPEHDLKGSEDAFNWENDMGFYVLEKTDYSEHDHDSYLDVFSRTQEVAEKLVELIHYGSDSSTGICDMFGNKDNVYIDVSPIKGLSSCNGWFVGIKFETIF